MRESRIFGPFERPEVWVQHADGEWYGGRLEAWIPEGDGWRAMVRYHVGVGRQHYLDLPADRVQQRSDGEPTVDGYRRAL